MARDRGTATVEELEGLKLDELKDRAKERGVKGTSRMKKAELVKALASAGDAAPTGDGARAAAGEAASAPARGKRVPRRGTRETSREAAAATETPQLTNLLEKLGEVLGLARAAAETTQAVGKLPEADGQLRKDLDRMRREAEEAAQRCEALLPDLGPGRGPVEETAEETRTEAAEMRDTYLGDDADALDGIEFMTMAEAGEVGHWRVLREMNSRAGHGGIGELVEFALPIQERHLDAVQSHLLRLAGEKDPAEEA